MNLWNMVGLQRLVELREVEKVMGAVENDEEEGL